MDNLLLQVSTRMNLLSSLKLEVKLQEVKMIENNVDISVL